MIHQKDESLKIFFQRYFQNSDKTAMSYLYDETTRVWRRTSAPTPSRSAFTSTWPRSTIPAPRSFPRKISGIQASWKRFAAPALSTSCTKNRRSIVGYYPNLREYIQTLESRDKLFRIPREVSRETELHPLVRWQFRGLPESERRAFLFENVASVGGRKYKMSVLSGACASSRAIYALGMGCQENEIFDRWIDAQKNPIDPVVVPEGPVQEIEIDSGLDVAVDDIPVPLGNPGFRQFAAPDRSTLGHQRSGDRAAKRGHLQWLHS